MTSGTSTTNAHKKIMRIEGIGGHTPPNFCCVCGKSTKKSEIVSCSPDCPNVCHPSCVDPSQPFHCSQTQHLRDLQGITQSVIVIDEEDIHTDQTSLSLRNKLPNQEDYITIIQEQQATISKLVKQLLVFMDGSLSLADLPATILSAKELIADCSAPVKSKAVTAKPDRISAEFSTQTQQDPALQDWWDHTPIGKKNPDQRAQLPPPPSKSETGRETRQQTQGGRRAQQKKRPEPPVCSHCRRRGHNERDCRNKASCDFCKARGHTLNNCRWKASADKAELLERELRNFVSEYRSCQTQKTVVHPQPLLPSPPLQQRYFFPPPHWAAHQLAVPSWSHPNFNSHQGPVY